MSDITSENLKVIIHEMSKQTQLQDFFPKNELSFPDLIADLTEYADCNEQGLAYETVVAYLERYPFVLSTTASNALIELASLFGPKISPEDMSPKNSENI